MNEGWIFREAEKYRCILRVDNNLSEQQIEGGFKGKRIPEIKDLN